MPDHTDFESMYCSLFRSVTQAVELLEQGNLLRAYLTLVDGQRQTEALRLKHCNLSTIPPKGAQTKAP